MVGAIDIDFLALQDFSDGGVVARVVVIRNDVKIEFAIQFLT